MKLKKYTLLIIILFIFLAGCESTTTGKTVLLTEITQEKTIEQIIGSPPRIEDTINIGTFNIQIFGKAKREKEHVLEKLVEIVSDYDIIAIQEIKDIKMETTQYFLEKINEIQGNNYSFIESERVGRSNSKESYAFYYDNEKIEYLKSFIFPDEEDLFEREPFIAYFRSKQGDFDFYLINIHTKPSDAEKEIKNLDKVRNYMLRKHPDDNDLIFLGDFNADGSYSKSKSKALGDKYFWAIPDWFDTTVAKSENAYDRIVFLKENKKNYAYVSGVDKFQKRWEKISEDEMKEISDHYPVWAKFYVNTEQTEI
jgi:deoxyribonuclease-1-like protein